jgi:cysteine synthase
MMPDRIYDNIVQLTGDTPLVRLNRINNTRAEIIAKLEYFNPMGSVKDRIGAAMLADAAKSGLLKPGGKVIEATSGNTGIALAYVGAALGYEVTLVMPASMSRERRAVLRALGAELVLTEASEGMKGALNKAEQLLEENPGAFMPRQFSNPANPQAHREGTAEEIWKATDGKVDVLVAGVGTGGTLTGCGGRLKQLNPKLKVIAVEPEDSSVISGGPPGPHSIMGIGAGFIPENLDTELIDQVIKVGNLEAMDMARLMAKEEGLLVGISSGAAMAAALRYAAEEAEEGCRMVVIIPSFGERYLSTDLFSQYMD